VDDHPIRRRDHADDFLAVRFSKIDQPLDALTKITPPGTSLTRDAIAEFCGCHRELIRNVELRAIRKLRSKLLQSLHGDDRVALLRSDAIPRVAR
jgi:hypothetical protein